MEAMNIGRCVLSTSIGAEGINYTDKENIVIANTKQEWIDALNMLKNNYTKVVEIGNNASAMVQQNYKQNTYADKLIKFIKEIHKCILYCHFYFYIYSIVLLYILSF
ncbi:MAG: glycosyltransferase [Chitinophagales bacterium]